MRATDVLVRWQGGWRWVNMGSPPDVRIPICQGHSGDGSEVIRKAQAELDTYGEGQSELTVGIDPQEDDPVPGVDWIEGDELFVDGDWREVEAFALTLNDSTGRWVPVPQFGAILDIPEQRIARTLRNIGGLNGGTSHLARPVGSLPPPGNKP